MAEPTSPGPGRSTSDAALSDLQNGSHAVTRRPSRLRAAREQEQLARRRKWDRL
jgi:hypothetical protein